VGQTLNAPIPIKMGVRVAPHDVLKVSNFCNKTFRDFRSTGGGGQNLRFPLTLLVIVATVCVHW